MKKDFLFSYLNLPEVPAELEEQCLRMIDLIDNDYKLNQLNKLEGIGHNITYIPPSVNGWIYKNILSPNFNTVPDDMIKKTMLHVSHYIKHKEGNGVHPTHYDYGRNFAINYIIDPGGDNVITYWTNENNEIKFQIKIEPRRWHILKVKPDLHGAKGIRIGGLRSIISICFSPENLENFDPYDYFKKILP
jgi:hypothetical protein